MPGATFLEGDRLTFRPVEQADYEFIHRHWTRPDVRRATNGTEPRRVEDLGGFVEDDDTVPFLVCRDGDPVGFLWLFHLDEVAGRAEVGYWIVESERGNGYATEALDLAVGYAFDERRLHKVMARVFAWNDASRAVLEKAGFEREGYLHDHYYVDGEYVDTYLYGIRNDDA